MKKLLQYSTGIILIGLITFTSCKEELSAEEKAQSEFLKQLSGTWAVNVVEVDSKIVTDAFVDMQITFDTKKRITVVNPVGNIWPASSTFKLQKSDVFYDLLRSDGVEVILTDLTADELGLEIGFATPPGGRSASVAGIYAFRMNKN